MPGMKDVVVLVAKLKEVDEDDEVARSATLVKDGGALLVLEEDGCCGTLVLAERLVEAGPVRLGVVVCGAAKVCGELRL